MEVHNDRAELGYRSSNVINEASSDLAMATHLHRDFSIDSLPAAAKVSNTSRDTDQQVHSLDSANGEHHNRSYSQRETGKNKKKREEYDPELEKLVRERVQDLHVREKSHQARQQQILPTNERDDQAAPAVPPRTSRRGGDSRADHTNNSVTVNLESRPPSATVVASTAKTCVCGNCLGSSTGVCQQCSGLVITNGDHDYINQDHLDSILEEQEDSSMVKRRRQDSEEGDDFMDEDTADAVLTETKHRRAASVRSTVSTTSSLFNLEPLKSSSGHNSQGHACRTAVPDPKPLGEFERRLLLAKQKGRSPMPNVMDVPWYHPGITRHIAECLLLSREIKDGTYLLRQSGATLALSVRCQSSTRHYRIVWDGKQFTFGLGKFPTLEALQSHFNNKPIISGDSGVLVQLCYPYPRAVSEPAVYEDANVVTTGLTDEEIEQLKERLDPKSSSSSAAGKRNSSVPPSEQGTNVPSRAGSMSISTAQKAPDLSINSKEGYLTKLGFHRKNWKRRWFVLYRNELKYFNNKDDKEPIKTINIEDVTSVSRDDSTGKSHCFRVVTGYRTFFMYAVSDTQANEWVQVLQWKLSSPRKESPPKHQSHKLNLQ